MNSCRSAVGGPILRILHPLSRHPATTAPFKARRSCRRAPPPSPRNLCVSMVQAVASNPTTDSTAAFKLVGAKGFVRHNPKTDRFQVHRFHHFEFYCGDATNTSQRFGLGLGLSLVSRTDQGTGNALFASYVMRSNDVMFSFTAPYGPQPTPVPASETPMPWYDPDTAHAFLRKHGLGVRAVGVVVGDAREAFERAVAHGARPVQAPVELRDELGALVVSEIALYGDVVLRFLSGDYRGHYLPGFAQEREDVPRGVGLQRVDHAVGNVPDLAAQVDYLIGALGFHDFAEFTSEDVGTIDSGLNSVVLASNNEMVLLPINEPTFGTRRKSQIQTYLEQNGGPGLQHLALKTDDIFATLRAMRARSELGGFDFVPRPSDEYYRALPEKIGDVLSADQYRQVEELGILVDRDDQGVLLQIFTKPLGDRPTVFIEIIQRLCGAEADRDREYEAAVAASCPLVRGAAPSTEVGGCGGFGKGNFSELFKSIETYETELGIN